MAENTFSGTGKWSTVERWSLGHVPEATEDVVITGSGICEINTTAAKCRSLDASAFKGTLKITTGSIAAGEANAPERAGMTETLIKLGTEMTFTTEEASSIKCKGTHASKEKIFSAGKKLPEIIMEATAGKVVLAEATELTSIKLLKGEFDTNGMAVTITGKCSGGGVSTRVLNFGSSVVKFTAGASPGATTLWTFTETTGLTLTLSAATIEITNTEAGPKEWATEAGNANLTIGTITVTGENVLIGQSNTITTLNNNTARASKTCKATLLTNQMTVTEGTVPTVNQELKGTAIPAGTIASSVSGSVVTMSQNATETVGVAETIEIFPAGLLLQSGKVQTVTTLATNGKAGQLARLAATGVGTQAKIKAAAKQSVDFMIIQDSLAEGTSEWYAGVNGRLAANDTNWKAEAPPASSAGLAMVI